MMVGLSTVGSAMSDWRVCDKTCVEKKYSALIQDCV